MEASTLNMSLMQHMNDTETDDLDVWMSKYANALTSGALARVGLLKLYNSCEPNNIISIKTEDKGMFGVSHKINVVTFQQTETLLGIIDNMYGINCVQQLTDAISKRKGNERIVVNVMCGAESQLLCVYQSFLCSIRN